MERSTMKWKKCKLSFNRHSGETPPPQKKAIELLQLPESIDEDYLEMFFEHSGCAVAKVEHSRQKRTAAITFENRSGRAYYLFN